MVETVARKAAGCRAVDDFIKSGTIVGLGTGATVQFVLERLAEKLATAQLSDITCVPTSEATRKIAEQLKLPLATLDEHDHIDVTIDGADEVDAELNLVKGRGAALLREKMVAQRSKKLVIVVDEKKLPPTGKLGACGAMPVEIVKYCHQHTLRRVLEVARNHNAKCEAKLRMTSVDGLLVPLETDNSNYIVDLFYPENEPVEDCAILAADLTNIASVVEHGLFLNMASACVVGLPNGETRVLTTKV